MAISTTRDEQSGSPQPFLGSIKPSRTFQIAQQQPTASYDRPKRDAQELLEALWRSPDRIHQIGQMNRRVQRFQNIPVIAVSQAVDRAHELSDTGSDAYFACAEYMSPESRTADNVSGAYAFWMDIDLSEQKYSAGKGYKTAEDALAALKQFCVTTGLPEATHIIESGSGFHGYWVMDVVVERDPWQEYAAKLKSLTNKCGLLADGCRTADIASVLRLPGTLNHKYDPPKPVSLRFASGRFIKQRSMLHAIDTAHEKFCGTKGIKVPSLPSLAHATTSGRNVAKSFSGPLDIERLAAALTVLDPDCDENEWSLRRIAPLALAASEYPNRSRTLYELARSWSSGELRGWSSTKWMTPGNNGYTGKEVFDGVWSRFLNSRYRGRPVTLGTIFHDADRLATIADDAEGDE